MLHADKMVLLDDTILAWGFTYVNRNRIKGPFGEVWITVPLKRKGRGRQKIKDLEIYQKNRWEKDFRLTLYHFYSKSLFYEPLASEIQEAIKTEDDRFLGMAFALLTIAKRSLDIDRSFIMQSEIDCSDKGTDLLITLAKEIGAKEVLMPYFSRKVIDWAPFRKEKIQILFLRYDPPQYPQFWGSFLKRLSVLDLLFCCGPNGKCIIERGSHLYESSSVLS